MRKIYKNLLNKNLTGLEMIEKDGILNKLFVKMPKSHLLTVFNYSKKTRKWSGTLIETNGKRKKKFASGMSDKDTESLICQIISKENGFMFNFYSLSLALALKKFKKPFCD